MKKFYCISVLFIFATLTSARANDFGPEFTVGAMAESEDYFSSIWYYDVYNAQEGHKILTSYSMDRVDIDERNYHVVTFTNELEEDVCKCHYRLEERKLYYLDVESNKDLLILDFNLQNGDTYTNPFSGVTYKVCDVRDTLMYVGSELAKRSLIELQSTAKPEDRDIWIEGIGSASTGILQPGMAKVFDNIYLLSHDTKDLARNHFFPSDSQIKTASTEIRKLDYDPFEIDFNEWISQPDQLNAEFEGDVLHIWGEIRHNLVFDNYMVCQIHEGIIQVKDCPSFRQAYGESRFAVDMRFEGFTVNKYDLVRQLLVYGNSAHTTKIGDVDIITTSPSPLYDLQGRQLQQKPSKGMYIQRGKKVLVK